MGGIISTIKNRIQISSQNKERDYVIKNRIANIGEIIEEEDKIICYVKQDMLAIECIGLIDVLFIDGFFKDDENNRKYLNRLNLDKPIYYIFDGIYFDWCFRFCSRGDCNNIFRNCTFRIGITITKATNVTFENNTYINHIEPGYLIYTNFFSGKNIKKITFINENFIKSDVGDYRSRFGMDIDADTVEMINTHIKCDGYGDLNICANKMIINNSDIDTDKKIKRVKRPLSINVWWENW